MKKFIGLDAQDAVNLVSLAPVFERRGREVTDSFYEILGRFEETRRMVEGRIDALKATHAVWLKQLFEGEYGEAYYARRRAIGMAHVRIGLDSMWCEAVMSVIRTHIIRIVREEITDPELSMACCASLVRILDLDLMVINRTYVEERLDRVSDSTGIPRELLENLVRQAR